jgi:holo-[acyl-carrier-protein] synthase|tara:strand:- start:12 stop:365 length:354 start_codon:yes stop_codon:yes gene_type:complete
MIEKFGIGIDVTSIQKFKKKPFKKNESFYKLIFSKDEIMYCLKFKNPYERFAGKFALKEALIKSIDRKIGFSEIETSNLKSKPIIRIKKLGEKYNFIVSLSHENDFAISVVISERIK